MKVSKEIYDTAQTIISQFDPDRLKSTQLEELAASRPVIKEANPSSAGEQAEQDIDLSIQAQADKWEKVVKQIDVDEKIEEVKDTDFAQKQKEYMEKMMGCSKDHAKEIDLYNKTYADKIDRVKTQMKQA